MATNKFKVGDKVKVVSTEREHKKCHLGKVYTIDRLNPNGDFVYGEHHYGVAEPCGYVWRECELELVTNEKIVITHDGKTTTATLYRGDGSREKATASCSPEDTFDFTVGAELAMKRLMEKVNPPEYYNGKVVCVDARKMNQYTVGKVYQFVDGKVRADDGFEYPVLGRMESFEDWARNTNAKFIPIVE